MLARRRWQDRTWPRVILAESTFQQTHIRWVIFGDQQRAFRTPHGEIPSSIASFKFIVSLHLVTVPALRLASDAGPWLHRQAGSSRESPRHQVTVGACDRGGLTFTRGRTIHSAGHIRCEEINARGTVPDRGHDAIQRARFCVQEAQTAIFATTGRRYSLLGRQRNSHSCITSPGDVNEPSGPLDRATAFRQNGLHVGRSADSNETGSRCELSATMRDTAGR